MERDAEHFEINPIHAASISDAAGFLNRWFRAQHYSEPPDAAEDSLVVERRLRWLLLENPAARAESRYGYCIRDRSGAIRGLNLFFPADFLAGSRRLTGLCSGSYFVEPAAQTLGFFVFKKYLKLPGYPFFFATTCNAKSAPLWRQLGGSPMPESDREYLLPLRPATLLPALVEEKTGGQTARKLASIVGRCADTVLRFRGRPPAGITVTPCRDWEKLADLFYRHRLKDRIAADRSMDFLRWRYGQNTDGSPSGVYLVGDRRGSEGWFALGQAIRGRHRQIRGCVLLDVIWPRERMSFADIFPGILQAVHGKVDALWFRRQHGIDWGDQSRRIIRIQRRVPAAYFIVPKGATPISPAVLDLTGADGDTALPISPLVHTGMHAIQDCTA